MPFTLSHAAAALPFRRALRILPSALVFGTFAPDLEYFLRLRPGGGYGHTLVGALVFSLPMGIVALVIFHHFVKFPLVSLLPTALQRRLAPHMRPFPLLPIRRFAQIVLLVLLGIATHLAWDVVTHDSNWLYRHWAFLRHEVALPRFLVRTLGRMQVYKILQYISSIGGLVVLAVWCRRWYRRAEPSAAPLPFRFSPARRWACVVLLLAVATSAGILRGLHRHQSRWDPDTFENFAGKAIVTFGAVLWWELVVMGLFVHERQPDPRNTPTLAA